jgi:hypothetical protein
VVDRSTTSASSDDEQWLAALVGTPDSSSSLATNLEATALRAALQAEVDRIMETTDPMDDLKYQRLLIRLRDDGVFGNPVGVISPTRHWLAFRPQVWAAAASVVLACAALVRLSSPLLEAEYLTRGGATVIVRNPIAKTQEWTDALQAAGAEPTRYEWCDGSVVLSGLATPQAIDYLTDDQRRILPDVRKGKFSLMIAPETPQPCGAVDSARDRLHRLRLNAGQLYSKVIAGTH